MSSASSWWHVSHWPSGDVSWVCWLTLWILTGDWYRVLIWLRVDVHCQQPVFMLMWLFTACVKCDQWDVSLNHTNIMCVYWELRCVGPIAKPYFQPSLSVSLSVCVCVSVCLWPTLLPFNVNRFWWNLVTRTLFLSLIHIWRCRRSYACRSRWSPYH